MQTLESPAQGHQQVQDMTTDLGTELKTASEKLAECDGPAMEEPSAEQNQLKSQVCCSFCIMEPITFVKENCSWCQTESYETFLK